MYRLQWSDLVLKILEDKALFQVFQHLETWYSLWCGLFLKLRYKYLCHIFANSTFSPNVLE